jgi:hypothetical protein
MQHARTMSKTWWWAALLSVALVAASCSGDDHTSTPAATPTSTPVPRIDVVKASTVGNVVSLLPQTDAECLRQALEGSEALLESAFSFDDTAFPADVAAGCLSNESLVLLFVGSLENEAGGLSDQTVVCIREALGAVNLTGLASTASSSAGDSSAGLGAAIGLLLCLTKDEAERVSASRFLGDKAVGLGPLSLQDLRCVVERSDLQALSATLEQVLAGGVPGGATLAALAACASGQ